MVAWLGSIFAIFLVDLVLSGDNAVVIGVAASGLPRDQRTIAIIVGGGSAIVLRVVFALVATFLLQLRFIGIIGSIVLLFIAIRLLVERSNERHSERAALTARAKQSLTEEEAQVQAQSSQTAIATSAQKKQRKRLLVSIVTILLADVTMSLDNVLAVGGLAAGNIVPLIIGLIFSVIFLLVGSALVAEFISRLPWLLDVACLIVAWTAAQIFLGDDSLNAFFEQFTWTSFAAPIIALLLVIVTDVGLCISNRHQDLRSG